MKNYNSPVLTEMNDILEGVYAASGSILQPPSPENPPAGDNNGSWRLTAKEWTNHNSGHLSCFKIILHNESGKRMCNLKVWITFDKKILDWENISYSCGGTLNAYKVGDYTIALEHTANYNGSENVEFHIQTMHFEHDIPSYCDDGQLLRAYAAPIGAGFTYPIPAGDSIIVTWNGGTFLE